MNVRSMNDEKQRNFGGDRMQRRFEGGALSALALMTGVLGLTGFPSPSRAAEVVVDIPSGVRVGASSLRTNNPNNLIVNNNGRLDGNINFSRWSGGDVLNNNNLITTATTVNGNYNFGGGFDTLNNTGSFVFVGRNVDEPSTLNILGLEQWNNAGDVFFGVTESYNGFDITDGAANDRIVANGTSFAGSPGSRLWVDVVLQDTQAGCSAAANADCLDLSGGSTSGVTYVHISDQVTYTSRPSYGSYNPEGLTIVDVAGGVSHAGDFVVDPETPGYSANEIFGGAAVRGVFAYSIVYDSATQRHNLVGLPSRDLFAFAQLPAAAQDVWRMADTIGLSRTVDVGEGDGRVWGQLAGERTDRDSTTSYSAFGQTAAIDLGYRQNTGALTFGVDMVRPTGDQGFLLGAMAGLTDSELTYNVSAASARLSGEVLGLYGGYRFGPGFVDGTLTVSHSRLEDDVPAFTLAAQDKVSGDVYSYGGRIEAGWAIPLGTAASVSPLVDVAYVTTRFDDVKLPSAEVHYDNSKSLRAGLGARLTGNTDAGASWKVSYSLTGRYWSETDGKANAAVRNAGAPVPLGDNFDGSFGEISGVASIGSGDLGFTGFLQAGSRFADAYTSYSLSAGLRYHW